MDYFGSVLDSDCMIVWSVRLVMKSHSWEPIRLQPIVSEVLNIEDIPRLTVTQILSCPSTYSYNYVKKENGKKTYVYATLIQEGKYV